MKSASILFLITVFAASLALPQAGTTAAPPKTAATKTTPKAAPKATPKTAPAGKTLATKNGTTVTKKSYKTTAKKGPLPPAQTWRNRQLTPSQTRYKEIQQALAEKGYLKQEPNGVWDSQSEDAMKQFQTEKKLPPTGKINSPSLIGLGLGPKAPDPIISPPNVPTPLLPPPGDSPASPQH